MIGKILGKESRAKELASGMESIVADLKKLSGTSEKNVYVAGVTINGSNTLNTTFPVYFPFNLVNANNAYKGDSTAYKVVLNVEQLAKMKIDLTIIDPSSSNKLAEQDSQLVMKYIHGINNDSDKTNDIPLYVTVPIVWDSINYDCALASAYYIEYLLYGTLTHDQVVKKIENVFKVFYGDHGKNVLSDMSKFFVEKSSANNVELPILSEVKIVLENGKYLFKAA
jgi:iron complex transport system substrate-binding protein